MSEWKPGDVAMVRSMYDTEVVGVRTGVPSNMGWAYSMELTDGPGSGGSVSTSTQSWSSDPYGTRVIRPLVVIDVEDDEQIDRLAGAMDAAIADPSLRKSSEMVRAALREFASPKPPKPEEPTGLGAVVEDANGDYWTYSGGRDIDDIRWWISGVHAKRKYAAIDAVKVRNKGWSS